jgi:hypothetical protein
MTEQTKGKRTCFSWNIENTAEPKIGGGIKEHACNNEIAAKEWTVLFSETTPFFQTVTRYSPFLSPESLK